MAGLDTNAAKFVVGVSTATGIDPRVVVAWVVQEGAYAPNGTGHFNYLNLRPVAGDKNTGVSPGGYETFTNVNDAIYSTVKRIKSNHAISATAHSKPTPREQIKAISASSWATSHYGPPGHPGENLYNRFAGIFGGAKGLDDSYVGPAQAGPIAATANTGSAADAGSYDSGNAAHDAARAAEAAANKILGPFKSIADLIHWIGGNWDRIFLVMGGAVLVIIALIYLTKSQMGKMMGGGAAAGPPTPQQAAASNMSPNEAFAAGVKGA